MITQEEARRFIIWHQELEGRAEAGGPQDLAALLRKLGCIQYDPLDVCGKNHHLVFLSRMPGYRRKWLYEGLYEDRSMLEGWDKMLSIYLQQDWPRFARLRQSRASYAGDSAGEVGDMCRLIAARIRDEGPLSSLSLDDGRKMEGGWGTTSVVRVALDRMFYSGALIIYRRENTRRYFDLTEHQLPLALREMPDPFEDICDYYDWHILRRIRGIGMVQGGAPEIGYGVLKTDPAARKNTFRRLLERERILPVKIAGMPASTFYVPAEEWRIFCAQNPVGETEEAKFIAPLDNMIWDRDSTRKIFDFDYKWEVYTPAAKRQYGYYVLPILYKNRFIGRIEPFYDKKMRKLRIGSVWMEKHPYGAIAARKAIQEAAARMEAFLRD